MQEQGGKVQAVSDALGATYNEGGLDIKALRKHLKEGGSIDTFSGGKPCTDEVMHAAVSVTFYTIHSIMSHTEKEF